MDKNSRGSVAVKTLVWLVIIALLAAPAVYFYLQEEEIEVSVQPVRRGVVEDTIAAISSGTIMPAQRALVAAGMMGTVQAVHVEEGERVGEGALLVTLHHNDLDAQVALARANLEAGRTRLNQARLGVEIQEGLSGTQRSQAAAQLAQAEREYQRLLPLAEQNAIARRDLDQAALALQVAREAKIAADTGLREGQVRQEEVSGAHAVIEQLEAALAGAQAAREKAFVRAPFGGVVAELMLKPGEAVAMGLPLLHLVQDDALHVEAPFDEANAARLAVGQPARIEVDAYSGEVFAGVVSRIAPVVSMGQDLARTLKLRVDLLDGQDKLLAGMSADVTIVAEKIEEAVYVPSESLIRDETAYVVREGRAWERHVETGIGNWEHRQVLSGLDDTETIVTTIAVRGLRDGVKIRVVDEPFL